MFAMLGSIRFQTSISFEGISSKRAWDYAQHAVIEGKPKLQYVGEALGEIVIDLVLHVDYCDPDVELAKLRVAASRHEALPFVYGSGHYVGVFVIRQIDVTMRHTDGAGVLLSTRARAVLLEHDAKGAATSDLRIENNAARTSGAGGKTRKAAPSAPPSEAADSTPSSRIVRA
ncbi:phage tail protein [Neomegalonema sp.]|uniref:phage tail protein n=1 Tax=Neomegalonema sp. TaxID=2039713 RepID=UPI00260A6658|nr:phage tail protein [Neomegalonema sp.]MDD2870079.1 phage tail protein [Neomegalonema sp.]